MSIAYTHRVKFNRLSLLLVLPAFLALPACEKEEPERPPSLSTGSSSSPAGTGPGQGGANSNPDTGEASDVILGSVAQFRDDTFLTVEDFAGTAKIHVLDEKASSTDSFDYDGVSFLSDLPSRASTWVAVDPETDATMLPTLSLHDSRLGAIEAPLVPRAIIEDIMSGLIVPAVIVESAAQLLVRVVDETGTPIAAVQPQVLGGPDLVFAGVGPWSDAEVSTGSEGLFLAYNIPASSLPGQSTKVILTGSLSEEFSVQLVAGAVTYVTYVAGP